MMNQKTYWTLLFLSIFTPLAFSAPLSTEFTQPVLGTAPELTIGVSGCLNTNERIYIDTNNEQTYKLFDLDGDNLTDAPIFGGDESLDSLNWYLLGENDTKISQGTLISKGLELIIPKTAVGKRIGLSITPKTKIGLPSSNNPIELMNINQIAMIDAKGNITYKNNPFLTCGDNGVVEQGLDFFVAIYRVNTMTGVMDSQPIKPSEFSPKTRDMFEVKVYEDSTMKKEITEKYIDKIEWYLHEPATDPLSGFKAEPTASNIYRFKIQSDNREAQYRSSQEESEQGLMLSLIVKP